MPRKATERPSGDSAGDQASPTRAGAASNINRRGTDLAVAGPCGVRTTAPSATTAVAASSQPAIAVVRDGSRRRSSQCRPIQIPNAVQCQHQVVCVLPTLGAVLRETRPDESGPVPSARRMELRAAPVDHARESRRRGPRAIRRQTRVCRRSSRRAPRRTRKYPSACPRCSPRTLLGRHVRQRPADRPRIGRHGRVGARARGHRVVHPGQPEVQQLDAAPREHHVGGLQITVDDVVRVRRGESLGDLDRAGQGGLERQRSSTQARRRGSRPRAAPSPGTAARRPWSSVARPTSWSTQMCGCDSFEIARASRSKRSR